MTVRFRPGQFYGVRHERTQGGIFELGVLEATAPEHDDMSRAFRQRFGMPPGAWRRRMFDGYKTAPQAGD